MLLSIVAKNHERTLLAAGSEPEQTVLVLENNWYFAPAAVNTEYLTVTGRTYTCPYKGVCYWVDLNAPGMRARNIAWVYYDAKPGYEMINRLIGFYSRETSGTMALLAVPEL